MYIYAVSRTCAYLERMKMKKYLTVLMLAGMLSMACGQGENDGPVTENGSEPLEELTWFNDDFNAASTEAEISGKPLLIDMYADWCGPCVTLGEEYFTSEEMHPVLSNFVLLRLDVDSPAGGPYAMQYNVSAIPCIVIAKADGTEIDRIVGTTPTIGQYATVLEEILQQI